MKILALLFLLAGSSAVLADTDALENGDFSDGSTHWDGDIHVAGGAADDSNSTKGVVVSLRSGDWTKISQLFDGKSGDYILTITYTTPPGMTISDAGRGLPEHDPEDGPERHGARSTPSPATGCSWSWTAASAARILGDHPDPERNRRADDQDPDHPEVRR